MLSNFIEQSKLHKKELINKGKQPVTLQYFFNYLFILRNKEFLMSNCVQKLFLIFFTTYKINIK